MMIVISAKTFDLKQKNTYSLVVSDILISLQNNLPKNLIDCHIRLKPPGMDGTNMGCLDDWDPPGTYQFVPSDFLFCPLVLGAHV